jgi:hypothetical protein
MATTAPARRTPCPSPHEGASKPRIGAAADRRVRGGPASWRSDIGDFLTLSAPQLPPELLDHWIQLGAVSGAMRAQDKGFTIGDRGRRLQIPDEDVLPIWRRSSGSRLHRRRRGS